MRLSLAESSLTIRPGYTDHGLRPGYQVNYVTQASEPPIEARDVKSGVEKEEDDADLAAAIAASLREMETPKPSAPGVAEEEERVSVLPSKSSVRLCNSARGISNTRRI
jgi:hypothetical protein